MRNSTSLFYDETSRYAHTYKHPILYQTSGWYQFLPSGICFVCSFYQLAFSVRWGRLPVSRIFLPLFLSISKGFRRAQSAFGYIIKFHAWSYTTIHGSICYLRFFSFSPWPYGLIGHLVTVLLEVSFSFALLYWMGYGGGAKDWEEGRGRAEWGGEGGPRGLGIPSSKTSD